MIVVAMLVGTNLFVPFVTQPSEVAMTLWLLSVWHRPVVARQYLLAIPVLGVLTVACLLVSDRSVSFDRWIGPALSLVALAAALHTVVRQSLDSYQIITSQGWFWICAGLSVFWLAYVPIDPFVNTFLRSHLYWARAAVFARDSLLPISFGLMTWGVMCQRPRVASPGHS